MVRRRSEGAFGLRALVYVLLGIAAATTALSLVGPNVDLTIAGLFYDPATGQFVGAGNPWLASLRENGAVAIATCIGVVALSATRFLPWRLPSVPGRSALALTLSLILGPGLLVNGILKPYGGRPRPAEVTEFGGNLRFVDWWNPTGGCDGNCSFMSGEATTAAWMFGPAMLVPPPWRAAAIGAAAAFTVAVGLLRMSAGGHFFTDVLIGVLTMLVILLAMNRLFARAP
jgi:membrane-associated PAP2 superfamily phosphatase